MLGSLSLQSPSQTEKPSLSTSTCAFTQPVAGSHESTVQTFMSSQFKLVPSTQVCRARSHFSTPVHASVSSQSASALQSHLHSLVQPSMAPTPASQSSPGSIMPLPHVEGMHVPVAHLPRAPAASVHSVPSAAGMPAAHWCLVVSHVSAPLQVSVSAQSAACLQANLQATQPSP